MDAMAMTSKNCAFDGCERPPHAKALCSMHYRRQLRTGSPAGRPRPELIEWRGYLARRLPVHPLADAQGYVLEHRRVAWEAFGPFPRDHHVHHVNGDRMDNRPENLEVLTAAAHGREHFTIDRSEVFRLRAAGLTLRQIGAAVGTDSGNVHRILKTAVA